MKKLLVIVLVMVSLIACKKETYLEVAKSNDFSDKLIGKWTVSSVNNVYQIKFGNTVFFNSDSSHTVIYSNYSETGNWTIENNVLTSNILDNSVTTKYGKTDYEIETISGKELILNSKGYKVRFEKTN